MKLLDVLRRRMGRTRPARTGVHAGEARPNAVSPWRAVSIRSPGAACAAARDCAAKRWLSAEAPRLPLPGCDADRCECHYRHHADRRAGPRRRFDREFFVRPFGGDERRGPVRGRRETDR